VGLNRRDFLKWFVSGFGVVSLGGIFYPVVKFLKPPPAVAGALGQATNVGALSAFVAGQLKAVSVNGEPAVVSNVNGRYTVYSLICTHLGCVVSVSGSALRCPCHGSVFSSTGTVTHGPATLPLPTYHTTIQNGSLIVGAIDLSKASYPAWYKGSFNGPA
jgi:Rieske Fe-S protein